MKGIRVVATGMGLLTPLGLSVEQNWKALCEGRSGIRRITGFEVSDLPCRVAGLLRDFNPAEFMDRKELRHMDPFIQYGMAASILAVRDSGLVIDESNADRVGVVIGSGMGGLQTMESALDLVRARGPDRLSPFHVSMVIANLAPGQVAIHLGARGPNLCISTACSAGTHCIGHAYRLIRHGHSDAVIAGGTEACVTRIGIAGFSAMRALSRRNEPPEAASRPFEKNRDGFVMGEGAGVLVLEARDHAIRRGARIYGEVIGYGENGDAFHIAAPSPEGRGAAVCMKLALEDADIEPSRVDYVNAHGTSTPYNDLAETQGIKSAFGPHAERLAVSSTKSMTGHMLGAAGAVEAAYCLLALQNGVLPPTINYDTPDPQCDLDYVPNRARKQDIEIAISNSFAFGGTNGVLVFRRHDRED
ncbi:MAG: beta-ketoacyl-ACP synthase II [bacterium]